MSDILVILFGVTLIYLSMIGTLNTFIKLLAVQGVMLFFIAIFNLTEINLEGFLFAALETILLKAIVIPYFLAKTVRETEARREIDPYLSNFNSLLITSLIFGFGFFIAVFTMKYSQNLSPLHFGIAISAIIKGLFIIVSRKKLITQIMGYMIIENGIFLLSLATAKEMPAIVSIGVSLDVFMVILIAGLFANKIKSTFEDQDIEKLTDLKD